MRFAVVGSGVSGLVSAYLLSREHEVTLLERSGRLGGHTNTAEIEHEGRRVAVDTGFIVFNERNYPGLCRLFEVLGVASQDAPMSFSAHDPTTGFEYGGNSWRGLVARKRNLVSPRFWRLARGMVRFARQGKRLASGIVEGESLEAFARRAGLSASFVDDYLVPMGAAIWSASPGATRAMPASHFIRFFDNHGMIDLRERPRWRTVTGGSQRYIDKMCAGWSVDVRTGFAVESVSREAGGVRIRAGGESAEFDHVVLACHSDQALSILDDPTGAEREVLGSLPYGANEAVLHSDERLLPKRRAAWSAWNYRLGGDADSPVAVTYDLSILQSIPSVTHLCVTLNGTDRVDPALVHGRWTYDHPCYTEASVAARARWGEISGRGRTHYCGAYWGNGFHEDGVQSALRVCRGFGAEL